MKIEDIKKRVSSFKEYCYKQSPEYVLSLSLFIVMFSIMFTACVFRLLGIGWFVADYSNIKEPTMLIQEIVKFSLFWFEGSFILKILCNKGSWFKIILLSFLCSLTDVLINYFIGNILAEVFTLVVAFIIPLLFNKDIKASLFKSLNLILITTVYGTLMLIGRYAFNVNSASNYIYGILSTIDYKLLFVNIYLFQKLVSERR